MMAVGQRVNEREFRSGEARRGECRRDNSSTCDIPLGPLGRTRVLPYRLVQGQLALMPHLPLAACTMSPML